MLTDYIGDAGGNLMIHLIDLDMLDGENRPELNGMTHGLVKLIGVVLAMIIEASPTSERMPRPLLFDRVGPDGISGTLISGEALN